jgi:hypothetical protein
MNSGGDMTRSYALGNKIIFDALRREISADEHVVQLIHYDFLFNQ